MDTQGISQVNQVLAQIRSIRAQSDVAQPSEVSALASSEQLKPTDKVEFSALIRHSLNEVNTLHQQSADLKEAFAREDPDVSLAQVMVAMQKASVSFNATSEVRNKFVDAYREVMRMSV